MPSLNWIGKSAVVNHHKEVPYRLLHCDGERSAGPAGQGNLLIQGDNLLALKALLPYYAGKVKCIYIDPPYNTGNEGWVYNDNVNAPEMKEWLHKTVGKEAEDLSRHDKWLCMMYPRLKLLKALLHKEGLVFVTVDDNEINSLRLVMDEIFGSPNWFAMLTRRAMHTVRNSSKDFNLNTDYTLVYGKNKSWHGELKSRYIRVPMDKTGSYPYDDEDGKGQYKLDPLHARNYYEPYEYTFKNGYSWSAPEGSFPRYSPSTLREMEEEGEVDFRGSAPAAKRYLQRVQEGRPPDALLSPEDVGFNSNGTTQLTQILGGGLFPQPKPVQFVRHLLTMVRDKNALILDSFAGSGTTGHAVMSLNKEDGGHRRFILVEIEEKTCREVTYPRLKKVTEGYSYKSTGKRKKTVNVLGLGGGFRFCTLGEPLFDANGQIHPCVTFSDLAHHIFFTETGEPLPARADGETPLIGTLNGTAYYLLWKGADEPQVLNAAALRALPPHDGPRVVYADGCSLSKAWLDARGVTFHQVPYEVRVS